jgi:hypothetical protein
LPALKTARKHYRAALAGSEWEKVRSEVSVLGNKNSRNFIMKLGSDCRSEADFMVGMMGCGECWRLRGSHPEPGIS